MTGGQGVVVGKVRKEGTGGGADRGGGGERSPNMRRSPLQKQVVKIEVRRITDNSPRIGGLKDQRLAGCPGLRQNSDRTPGQGGGAIGFLPERSIQSADKGTAKKATTRN